MMKELRSFVESATSLRFHREEGKAGIVDQGLPLEKVEISMILLDPRVQLHLCCFSAIGCYHYDECGRPSSSIWFSDWICAQ